MWELGRSRRGTLRRTGPVLALLLVAVLVAPPGGAPTRRPGEAIVGGPLPAGGGVGAPVLVQPADAVPNACPGPKIWIQVGPNGTSPDLLEGPVPLQVNWTIHASGGTPPYRYTVYLDNGTQILGANGTWTFRIPGYYQVDYTVESACNSTAGSGFTVYAYGSAGPDPIAFSLTATSGAAPLPVNVSATGGPPNGSYRWTTPGGFAWGGPNYSYTFDDPGNQSFGLCVYYAPGSPNASIDAPFWCGHSPTIDVTGATFHPYLHLTALPTNGTTPLNVSVWLNLTNASRLPTSARAEIAFGTTAFVPVVTVLQNQLVNVTSAQGSGSARSTYSGYLANLSDVRLGAIFVNPYNVPVTEYIATTVQSYNATSSLVLDSSQLTIAVTGNATGPPPPYPVLSLTVAPASGPAPFNTTANVTAEGGTGPYSLNLTLFPIGGNASGLPEVSVAWRANWSGALLSLPISLNATGTYMLWGSISDADAQTGSALADLSVVSAKVARPAPPLTVGSTGRSEPDGSGERAYFSINVSGGVPPYSVQWTFGDGSVGSSAPGATISHLYDRPGTYTPTVTVSDAAGQSFRGTLPPVIVASGPGAIDAPVVPGAPVPSFAPWIVGLGSVAAFGLVGTNLWLRRRRLRSEGEWLLADPDVPPLEPSGEEGET